MLLKSAIYQSAQTTNLLNFESLQYTIRQSTV